MEGGVGALQLSNARRSLDVDGTSRHPSGSTSPSSTSSASSSIAASMLLLRPRAFARQLSDDLRRRRESYAAGQFSSGTAGSCYSPLAGPGGSHLLHHHRHSVSGLQLTSGSGLHQQQRLHSVAVAAASYASSGKVERDSQWAGTGKE